MVKSLFVTASAGSGKTFRLTEEVRAHIGRDRELVVAATFTRAAAAEMEKRILEAIEKGKESPAEKLRLIMRAARVRFSTLDALFLRFLSTEACVPQVADEHEKAVITALADERFFRHPRVLADIEEIVIAARILHLQPEFMLKELDKSREALEAWNCSDGLLDDLRGKQKRMSAEYERLQEKVRAVAEGAKGNLYKQVVVPLLEPLATVDFGKALYKKSDVSEVNVAAADRGTPAYHALQELYPSMRRLLAEHLINSSRLRSALLKRFIGLRAEVLAEEKGRLGRLYFDDIPRALVELDGPESPDRPVFMARLFELGFHRTAHLLLDEFQDTSQIQFDLLRPLMEEILGSVGDNAEGERSIFLVGDWKQSIYQWRGAAPGWLKASIDPALASGQIASETLPYNYRSTPLLIHFFNHLVGELFAGNKLNLQAPPARPKHPYGGLSEVAAIPVRCERGDEPVYARLVEEIRRKREACGCPWGDMAVLCRTNIHMDHVAAALAGAGIPTSGVRGREFLSLREGTALYLSLVSLFSRHDGRFIPRSLSSLGFGEELSATLARLAGTVADAPRPHRFAAFASALRGLAPHFPRVLIETLWDEAERCFDRPDTADVCSFLSDLPALSHLITVPEGEHAERVKLATIHGTKGLEFPHVFIVWKEERDRAPEIPHPDDGCPLDLGKSELEFLETGPVPGAGAIAEAAAAMKGEKAEETANLLYVAATRAVKSLSIILRADSEGILKGYSERICRTAGKEIPGAERTESGWKRDYGVEAPRSSDAEELVAPDPVEAGGAAADDSDEMDPALRSAAVEAGIERGIRIHAALARISGDGATESPGDAKELTESERAALERFLGDPQVREILSRPGKVLTEQHLSDTRAFGIVDRLIIAPDRITLIDFKTGRVGHLADQYGRQMDRYRGILRVLFGGRPVECYLLFVDEPHRIVAIP